MLKNKLGMSPVIATALLLVVAVIALVGFQAWYTSYQTKILTNVESDKGVEYISNSGISNVIGDEIYFVNPKSTNLTLTKLEIGDTNCNVSQNLSPGLNRININNCDNNISPGLNTVTVFTDDRIFSENFFIENSITPVQSLSSNIFDSLLHVLDNPNNYSTSGGDFFGVSVSVSDSYALVGAYFEDDAGGSESGKAYLFDTVSGSLLHVLDNPNNYSTSANDRFGYSVSVSDSYALVGAYYEDDADGSESGKAYLFDTLSGSLLHVLDNPNNYSTSANDRFGYSVSVSDSYALVGAYYEDDADGFSSGKAYLFDTLSGSLLHVLDNPNNYSTSASDFFGYSVSVSDSYALVGAYLEDEAGGSDSGKAYLFDTVSGSLLHVLDNPNNYSTSAGDFFGSSVSVSDSYALVGAYSEDDAGGSSSGKAYLFDTVSGSLLHVLDNPNNYSTSVSDYFGFSVSVSDSYALVGARLEDDAGGSSSGKAYLFD